MKNFHLIVLFSALFMECHPATEGQIIKPPKIHLERSPVLTIKTYPIPHTPTTKQIEGPMSRHPTIRNAHGGDKTFRLTINDNSASYAKFENLVDVFDKISYVVSKPAAIVNTVKFVTLVVSSMIISSFVYPPLSMMGIDRRKSRWRKSDKYTKLTGDLDIDTIIELLAKNYDETLDRAGFGERSACRERSLCTLGDILASDFPGILATATIFSNNHLPKIDVYKNKYTKALASGFNQTDCDELYRTNYYECPTFQDYMRSYLFGAGRRRRHSILSRRRKSIFDN